jgi:hypothetical protein
LELKWPWSQSLAIGCVEAKVVDAGRHAQPCSQAFTMGLGAMLAHVGPTQRRDAEGDVGLDGGGDVCFINGAQPQTSP